MQHFDITKWADAVRGLAPEADQKRMNAHLDTGCNRCASLVTTLERVVKLAENDTGASAPNGTVRSVKAYFALNQPTRRSRLAEVGLSLDFDSSLQPATVNTRANEASPRQLTFSSDDYTLDLSVDPADGAGEVGVAGYCLRRQGDPVAGAPIFLICRGEFAGQGITGELGEFQFDTELADPMELWLFDDNDLPVAVSVNLDRAA